VTPSRTIAVAVLTFVAAVTAERVGEEFGTGRVLNIDGEINHALFHFSWAALTMALALGVRRARSAWSATGWTARSLFFAQMFALLSVAGNVLAGVGVFVPFPESKGDPGQMYIYLIHPHNVGEVVGVGSALILLAVCLVMLGVGVRGALRPRAQPA